MGILPSNGLIGGCAAGWGCIFMTGFTTMGLLFSAELLEWGCTFLGFWGKKILVSRDFGYMSNWQWFNTQHCNQCYEQLLKNCLISILIFFHFTY